MPGSRRLLRGRRPDPTTPDCAGPLASLPCSPRSYWLVQHTAAMAPAEREAFLREVMALLDAGVITPLAGRPHRSPVVQQGRRPHGLGGWRRCVALLCGVAGARYALAHASLKRATHCPSLAAGERFPLERAADALRASQQEARGGKVLLEG